MRRVAKKTSSPVSRAIYAKLIKFAFEHGIKGLLGDGKEHVVNMGFDSIELGAVDQRRTFEPKADDQPVFVPYIFTQDDYLDEESGESFVYSGEIAWQHLFPRIVGYDYIDNNLPE